MNTARFKDKEREMSCIKLAIYHFYVGFKNLVWALANTIVYMPVYIYAFIRAVIEEFQERLKKDNKKNTK